MGISRMLDCTQIDIIPVLHCYLDFQGLENVNCIACMYSLYIPVNCMACIVICIAYLGTFCTCPTYTIPPFMFHHFEFESQLVCLNVVSIDLEKLVDLCI